MSGRSRRRALGQHFLVDPGVAARIIALAGLAPGTPVLEIGPGQGALTGPLLRAGHPVVAVEIDPSLAAALRRREEPSLEVLEGDFLKLDAGRRRDLPRHVVANLPYSTGTAILEQLLKSPSHVELIVVMLQREVADRLCATPGSRAYGALSVLTALHAHARHGFHVPPEAFRPPPQVESSVIRLDVAAEPRVAIGHDVRLFRDVVRASFSQRRKTLRNALGARFGREVAAMALARASVEPGRRAETVSLAEFARLAQELGTGIGEGS